MNIAVQRAPTPKQIPSLWLNVVLFQVGWFGCVLGAAKGWPWLGVAVALVIVAFHLMRAANLVTELTLVTITLVIGALADSLLLQTGWIAYPSGMLMDGVAPPWILALWLLFATTLNVSMRWLKQRAWLAVVLGAICGPLSYWGASRLGAVQFADPLPLVLALTVTWALIMPLLMRLSMRYDGIAPQTAVAE